MAAAAAAAATGKKSRAGIRTFFSIRVPLKSHLGGL